MSHPRRVVAIVVVALLAVAGVALAPLLIRAPRPVAGAPAPPFAQAASPAAGSGDGSARTISVTGVGRVSVTPDMAYTTFGVETSNTNLAQAQSDNATQMAAVIAKLKSLGIADKDIQTIGYIVSPQYDKDQKVTGYRVDNSVRVTVRDLKNLGSTIDAVVAAGANRVTGISFDLSNKDAATQQAREQAVADARAKAEQYAKLVNLQLGAPVTISETSAPMPVAVPAAAPAAGNASTAIQPGEGTVSVSVQIVYEMK
ncbi:MAG TPA: SIMPL domain-containing protein [Thermomicrobiales bacterium]|nr:SIMPL domain-containing protein [Thermomicrobiales bacterium]